MKAIHTMRRKIVKRYRTIFFGLVGGVFLVFALSGCSNFKFRSEDFSNAGSEILQERAKFNCREKHNQAEYSECIKRINSSFDDWRIQKQQKNQTPIEKQ
jgi:hypothetical protein